jgi:hypothetical protein
MASAVTAWLRDNGHSVRLISSYRPAERAPDIPAARGTGAVRRLVRAAGEMAALLRDGSIHPEDAHMTNGLLRLLPPRQAVWKLRMHQYIARLSSNWRSASSEGGITLIDQGFLQAVYSLAVLTGHDRQTRLGDAIGLVPMPDLLVRLHVSDDVLAVRLADRRLRQGRLERLLEIRPAANLASVPIFNIIDTLVASRGVPVLRTEPSGDRQFDGIFREVESAVLAGMACGRQPVARRADPSQAEGRTRLDAGKAEAADVR